MVKEHDPCATVVKEEIKQAFPAEVFFNTTIPFLPAFERAALHGVPVALLKDAPGAEQAFDSLALELETRQDNSKKETP
jgi:cellulose biosynthesis protein BcsQ